MPAAGARRSIESEILDAGAAQKRGNSPVAFGVVIRAALVYVQDSKFACRPAPGAEQIFGMDAGYTFQNFRIGELPGVFGRKP